MIQDAQISPEVESAMRELVVKGKVQETLYRLNLH